MFVCPICPPNSCNDGGRDGEPEPEHDQDSPSDVPHDAQRHVLAHPHEDPQLRGVEEGHQHGQRLQRRGVLVPGVR